jgi:hypothetical protein
LPGGELLDLGDVAIDLEHGVVTKQLHPAVDNDLASVLGRVAQLAEPVTHAPKLRPQCGKVDRKPGLQQGVALRPTASLDENP